MESEGVLLDLVLRWAEDKVREQFSIHVELQHCGRLATVDV